VNVKDWVAELKNPIATLSNLDLLLDDTYIAVIEEGPSTYIGYARSSIGSITPYAKLDFGSVDEYLQLLRNRHYSALLADGSFVQMSIYVRRGKILRHRYCYYPCPVEFGNEELRSMSEEEDISNIVWAFLSDSERLVLRTPVRFDFDEDSSERPKVHVHFNHSNCRCAVSSAIYPCYFIKVIMRYFYPDIWERFPVLSFLDQETVGYWLNPEEELFLHLTSKRVLSR
jgi:hypothetical protein